MTGNILAILVTGLPAYVLVKVLTPAFYARKDVKTPVRIAMARAARRDRRQLRPDPGDRHLQPGDRHLGQRLDQFRLLFIILYARSQFRMPGWLVGRVASQLIAALAMAASLYARRRSLRRLVLRRRAASALSASARWSASADSSISPSPG